MTTDDRKAAASQWFGDLRDRIHARLEALEREAPEALYSGAPGTFVRKPWQRKEAGGGGGVGGHLAGRLFEKAGVHVSEVMGTFPPDMAATVPGAAEDPRFWAAGVSVIIHPLNPWVPTAHMNTRHIMTTQSWWGGGGDLTPMMAEQRRRDDPLTEMFHAGMEAACAAHPDADYAAMSATCDRYFHLHHRDEPRGTGGIFYDRFASGDGQDAWDADFVFTREVGEHFLDAYEQVVRASWEREWTQVDREAQEEQRGRYVEFNLLYDRGTTFGLKTGGNVETILSSMPPVVRWPTIGAV